MNEKERQNALNEVRILASIRSPQIVAYKEVFLTETSCTLWLNKYLLVLLWNIWMMEISFKKFVKSSKKSITLKRMKFGLF